MSSYRILYIGDADEITSHHQFAYEERSPGALFQVVPGDNLSVAAESSESRSIDCIVTEQASADAIRTCIGELEAQQHRIPVLVFAEPDSNTAIRSALNAGATDYVGRTDSNGQYEILAHRITAAIASAESTPVDGPWEQAASVISTLYEVTNQTDLGFESKLSRVLEIGADKLGYPVGYSTRIEGQTLDIIGAVGDHDLFQQGNTLPINRSFCQLALETDGPLTISDVDSEGLTDQVPGLSDIGLQCYIGAQIIVDGDIYGTLCFGAPEPRDPSVIRAHELTVKSLAQWVGYEIERGQYESELERQIDRLEEFTGVVSHDLRNPLNIAQGRLEMAQLDCNSSHLNTVDNALDRMEAIIEDSLTLARQGQTVSNKEPIEIGELMADCWDIVETGESELRPVDEFTVHGDRSRLSQIFENLFRNAVEHSPAPVTIRVGLLDFMYTSTRVESDGTFGFFVEDDGPGVPAGRRESVFDAGESTRRDGTGFGLSIVKRIAEAHGWEVVLTESFDGGARFEFTNVR